MLKNIEAYMQFLQEIQLKYNFIMKTCAPVISKHFTNLTSVINEGNSYEFPSADLHKAIINKLILNDQQLFRNFFAHIKKQFKENEKVIRENHQEFAKTMDYFCNQIQKDIEKNLINIDQYMKDWKKHALTEYQDLYHKEAQQMCNSDSKSKKKKKKNKKTTQTIQGQIPNPQANNTQKQEKMQQPQFEQRITIQELDKEFQQVKKKRNKKKKAKEGKLTNEELSKLDTDALINYIENKGMQES